MRRKLKQSVWERARSITTTFEGSGYGNATGNFDGMGLSLGFLQWNFGQKTLQPLLVKFMTQYPVLAKQIMQEGYDELLLAMTKGDALVFAVEKMNDSQNRIIEPWLSRLKCICSTKEFQNIQDEHAKIYIDRAVSYCNQFKIYTDRAFCLFFDIAVQNGSIKKLPELNEFDDKDKMQRIVEAVVTQSNTRYQEDVRARKECILNGKGVVHGKYMVFHIYDTDAFNPDITGDIEYLKGVGVIDNPEYWIENALDGGQIRGDLAASVMIQCALRLRSLHDCDLPLAVGVLKEYGIVNSPEYWVQNAVSGKSVEGAYGALLIQRISKTLQENDIDLLHYNGIISNPEYWKQVTVEIKPVKGEFLSILLKHTASKVKGQCVGELTEALDILGDAEIMKNKEYWRDAASTGKWTEGKNVSLLIGKIVEKMKSIKRV